MVTPTKQEILTLATEKYMKENIGFNLPETSELKEEGYLEEAKMELMSKGISKEEFDDNVNSVFEEMEQAKKIVAENEKLREKIKQLETQPLPQITQLAQPQQTVNLNLSLEVPQVAIDLETFEEPEEIEEVKQYRKICTNLKPKIRNLGVILKLLGQLIKLYLKD